jgi:hypothetical protein
VINRDAEVSDVQHFKVIRQGSNDSVASSSGIAEIAPAEKIKA